MSDPGPGCGRLRGELLDSASALDPYLERWDLLATEAQLPYCSPAWTLGWWRHAAPREARLRVVTVLEGDRVVAIAPLYAESAGLGLVQYRFLAADVTPRVQPVVEDGAVAAVAPVMVATLSRSTPRPDLILFEGLPSSSPWPGLFRELWPAGRQPWIERGAPVPAPAVTLEGGDFDSWMQSKSSNFRQQMRRGRRRLEAAGASFRSASTEADLDRDLASFARLHHGRWDDRGGSSALKPGVAEMLREAGGDLLSRDRLRLDSIEVDGAPISSHLFVTAGGEMSYWLGGFDERWSAERPSMVALVAAIETGFARGMTRLDLGPGGQEYKSRLADDHEELRSTLLAPVTSRYPLARARLAPGKVRAALLGRLSPEQKDRARALLERLRQRHGAPAR